MKEHQIEVRCWVISIKIKFFHTYLLKLWCLLKTLPALPHLVYPMTLSSSLIFRFYSIRCLTLFLAAFLEGAVGTMNIQNSTITGELRFLFNILFQGDTWNARYAISYVFIAHQELIRNNQKTARSRHWFSEASTFTSALLHNTFCWISDVAARFATVRYCVECSLFNAATPLQNYFIGKMLILYAYYCE